MDLNDLEWWWLWWWWWWDLDEGGEEDEDDEEEDEEELFEDDEDEASEMGDRVVDDLAADVALKLNDLLKCSSTIIDKSPL